MIWGGERIQCPCFGTQYYFKSENTAEALAADRANVFSLAFNTRESVQSEKKNGEVWSKLMDETVPPDIIA